MLTCVVAVDQREDTGPDEDQDRAWPAVVDGWVATRNGPDVVAIRLDDVMNDDEVDGACPDEEDINDGVPALLRRAGRHDNIVRIQDLSETANDGGDSTR